MLTSRQLSILEREYANMLACVRCGACLTSCPTYVLTAHEAEGPRGRVAMIRAVLEDGLPITPDFLEHQQSCLICDACTAACPAGVRMDPLQVALREAISSPSFRERVGLAVLGHLGLLRFVCRLVRLYQRSGLRWLARHLKLTPASERLLPEVPAKFLVPEGQVLPGGAERVALFAGCVMSTALADIDFATIKVLQAAGFEVEVTARQGCCGALHAHSGDAEGARKLARRNVAGFEGDGTIVVNSSGCGAMLKDYGHLLDSEEARKFSARVKDLTEVLAARSLDGLRLEDQAVAYQDACHLAHAQGIRNQPRAVLRSIDGLELKELGDAALCCGSAGIYNVLQPEKARELQRRKVLSVVNSGASTVVTCNPGCLLQLRAGLAEIGAAVEVKHLAQLVEESLPA